MVFDIAGTTIEDGDEVRTRFRAASEKDELQSKPRYGKSHLGISKNCWLEEMPHEVTGQAAAVDASRIVVSVAEFTESMLNDLCYCRPLPLLP